MLTDFRLKIFCTVVQCKNFTRAAKKLNISQPAVSQNIAELEQQVGDILLNRGNGAITPTPKGEILFKYAEKILHLYDSINSELVPTNSLNTSSIKLVACPIAVRFLLPDVIKKFQELNPKTEILLLERSDSDIESVILEGDADLGVMESEPKSLSSAPFAELSLSDSGKSMLKITFAYTPGSPAIDNIQRFILTAKTSL